MRVVNVALMAVLMVVVVGGALGKSVGHLSAKEKVGALRDLLLLQLSTDEEGVQISGPLFDVDLRYDGSSSLRVVDGALAEFTSDAEGQWQGSVADGQVLQAAGSGDGDSVVEFGDNSTAAIATDELGNTDFVYNDADGLTTTGEISSNGDVDLYGPSLDVMIDADRDGGVERALVTSNDPDTQLYEGAELAKPTEKPAPAPSQIYDDAQDAVVSVQALEDSIDAESYGSVQWLTDSLIAATRRPVVSVDPPQGRTPTKVQEALAAGEADTPGSYYTNAHQTSQTVDVFEVDGSDEPTAPTTPLNLTGVDVL